MLEAGALTKWIPPTSCQIKMNELWLMHLTVHTPLLSQGKIQIKTFKEQVQDNVKSKTKSNKNKLIVVDASNCPYPTPISS